MSPRDPLRPDDGKRPDAPGGAGPVVLCILDGWGLREAAQDNALALARLPAWDRLVAQCPPARILTSGGAVGLPDGQMGNSEVGHMTIGAGRIARQDLPRIDAAIADGSLAASPALTRTLEAAGRAGGRVHVLGLLSPGGVHSHHRHILALAGAAAARGLPVRIHAFLDGRDTPPRSAAQVLAEVEPALAALPDTRIASLCGRYYEIGRAHV